MPKQSQLKRLDSAAQYKDLNALLTALPPGAKQQHSLFIFPSKRDTESLGVYGRSTPKDYPLPLELIEQLANRASDVGMPILDLPFYGVALNRDGSIPVSALVARDFLWKAAGRGFNLVLAFDPSHWQGNDVLRDFYALQFRILDAFLKSGKTADEFEYEEKGTGKLELDEPMKKQYQAGQEARPSYQLIEESKTPLWRSLKIPEKRSQISYQILNKGAVRYRIIATPVDASGQNMPYHLTIAPKLGFDASQDLHQVDKKLLKKRLLAQIKKNNHLPLQDSWFAPRKSKAVTLTSEDESKRATATTRTSKTQEEANQRFWDRLVLAASLLLAIVGIIPVYLYWYKPKRAKEENVEVRITPANMVILHDFRRKLEVAKPTHLTEDQLQHKPSKVMPDKTKTQANEVASYIMDPKQAWRHNFWAAKLDSGEQSLNDKERADLDESMLSYVPTSTP